MASVFKPDESSRYVIDYTDASGRRRRKFTGLTRKRDAARVASQLDQRAAAIRNNLIPAVREVVEERMQQPISEHLKAYRVYLASKRDSAAYIDQVCRLLRRVVRVCDIGRLSDLIGYRGRNLPSIEESVQAFLDNARTRTGESLATPTRNSHLGSLCSFCRWAIRTNRLLDSSILRIQPTRACGERRRERRALTDEEICHLVATTRHRGGRGRIGRRSRAVLYQVAVRTGFRRSELAALKVQDFMLDGDSPYLYLRARHAKNRKDTKQPIDKDLAGELRVFLAKRRRTQQVWDIPHHASGMLRRDLATAGIPPVDAEGRVVDFHALRHTYITTLARHRVPTAHAQRLARHSSPQLTLKFYTHLEQADLARELDRVFAAGT